MQRLSFFFYRHINSNRWHWIVGSQEKVVRNHLQNQGLVVEQIANIKWLGYVMSWVLRWLPLTKEQRRRYIADLSQLVDRGTSLADSAIILADSDYPPKLLWVARNIARDLSQGGLFSFAAKKQKKLFQPAEMVMIRLAEKSGYVLCREILNMINELQRLNYGFGKQLWLSLGIRLVRMMILLYLAHIMTANLFKYMMMQLWIGGMKPPAVTVYFYQIFNSDYTSIVAMLAILIFFLYLIGRVGKKLFLRQFTLKIPIFGKIFKNMIAIQFFSALYPRLFTKWAFADALTSSALDVPYPYLRKKILFLADRIRFGAMTPQESINKISFLNIHDKISLQMAIDKPLMAQDFIDDLTNRQAQSSKLKVSLLTSCYLAIEVFFISWFFSAVTALMLTAYLR